MTDTLLEVFGFSLKTLVVVVGLAVFALSVAAGVRGARATPTKAGIRTRRLDQRRDRLQARLLRSVRPEVGEPTRRQRKAQARQRHESRLRQEAERAALPIVWVTRFAGDIQATAVHSLRHAVSAIVASAAPGDEVIVCLDSPGGAVDAYGLAAAQLGRLREAGLRTTVVVDRVAASGGYMMACVADRVVAAPFAILGSIGVYLGMPEFHRVMDRLGVGYLELVAGDHKRPISPFRPNTPEDVAHVQKDLDETHTLFRDWVTRHRPAVHIDSVADGRIFYGTRALELGLIDAIGTSDAILDAAASRQRVVEVRWSRPRSLRRRFGIALGRVAELLQRGASTLLGRPT